MLLVGDGVPKAAVAELRHALIYFHQSHSRLTELIELDLHICARTDISISSSYSLTPGIAHLVAASDGGGNVKTGDPSLGTDTDENTLLRAAQGKMLDEEGRGAGGPSPFSLMKGIRTKRRREDGGDAPPPPELTEKDAEKIERQRAAQKFSIDSLQNSSGSLDREKLKECISLESALCSFYAHQAVQLAMAL